MVEWVFILTPLLVLPIIFLLFPFLGCAQIAGIRDPDPVAPEPDKKPPNYRGYILGEPNNPGLVKNPGVVPKGADVIGYWRLVDAASSPTAKDEKGFQDGKYRTSNDADVTPGGFITGQSSLISSDPSAMGRFFNGGYVLVPAKTNLFTEDFTIEAWVLPGFSDPAEHTLFAAGGFYRAPFDSSAEFHGFQIYATNASWQVALLPGGDLFPSPPLIPPGKVRTHLAVTVQSVPPGASKKVTLFIDGKPTMEKTIGFYSTPQGAPLLIGVGSQEQEPHNLETLSQPNVTAPMRSGVQEVVLHKKALSREEIENHVDINR